MAAALLLVLLKAWSAKEQRTGSIAVFNGMGEAWALADGGVEAPGWPLRVKVARTRTETAAGFQHVPESVIRQSAVWFVLSCGESQVFHMRNVAAPLDIAFLDRSGRVLQVARMEPGSRLWPAPDGTCYALETAAGRMAEMGIEPGLKIGLVF